MGVGKKYFYKNKLNKIYIYFWFLLFLLKTMI